MFENHEIEKILERGFEKGTGVVIFLCKYKYYNEKKWFRIDVLEALNDPVMHEMVARALVNTFPDLTDLMKHAKNVPRIRSCVHGILGHGPTVS